MIDKYSYEDMEKYSSELMSSSQTIKDILSKITSSDNKKVEKFCASVEAYSNYLNSLVKLNKDADIALEYLKNRD